MKKTKEDKLSWLIKELDNLMDAEIRQPESFNYLTSQIDKLRAEMLEEEYLAYQEHE
jgi:hypothetical protein